MWRRVRNLLCGDEVRNLLCRDEVRNFQCGDEVRNLLCGDESYKPSVRRQSKTGVETKLDLQCGGIATPYV